MKLEKVVAVAVLLIAVAAHASPPQKSPTKKAEGKTFYVYTERGSKENHSVASGYMGDWGDIKMNQGWDKNPGSGQYCIKIDYSAERKQGAGWSGVFFQSPPNNWGDKKGGYNLDGFKKLTFMARGEVGGEVLDKFGTGGITGQLEEGDSDEASIGPIELSKEWKKYEIDLTGKDLSHLIGPFLWAANAESNPSGFTFYLDEIVFVK